MKVIILSFDEILLPLRVTVHIVPEARLDALKFIEKSSEKEMVLVIDEPLTVTTPDVGETT